MVGDKDSSLFLKEWKGWDGRKSGTLRSLQQLKELHTSWLTCDSNFQAAVAGIEKISF